VTIDDRVSQVIEIMESLDIMHEGSERGLTAYGEAAALMKRMHGALRKIASCKVYYPGDVVFIAQEALK
jgi:hypothetical protein